EKEFPDSVIDRVLDKLRENNLLNDAAFAQSWIENRARLRPRGARLLQQELRRKGISPATINAALPDENEELINAIAALQKILQSKERLWANLDEKAQQQKAMQYLMRRGFNYAVCKMAWEQRENESS